MYFIWNIQRMIKAMLWIEVLFLLLFSTNVFPQANSDYLKLLEGEASELKLDNKTKNSQKKLLPKSIKLFGQGKETVQGGDITELFPGLSQQQFEVVLKNNYIGSYLFYKRLSVTKKVEVYGFYQENPDPAKVRAKILQVSKK